MRSNLYKFDRGSTCGVILLKLKRAASRVNDSESHLPWLHGGYDVRGLDYMVGSGRL